MLELDKIYNEDCLIGMKQIPDGTIDAVICDLPYGTMKGAQLDGWEGVKTDWDEIIPTDKLFAEYERVLRMNGVAILFSQEPYTNHLRGYQYKNTNFGFGYPLMWRKNHFGNALIAKDAPVSYFEDMSVFFKRYDTSGHHPLRDHFAKVQAYIGKTKRDIIADIGQRADHVFRGDSSQFALCTAETYDALIERYGIDKMEGFKPYDELVKMDARFKRTFNLPEGQGFKSNVFEYAKDTDGFHPTQKPVSLIRDLVLTYTNEGDTVLTPFLGIGSEVYEAVKLNRFGIGFELKESYFKEAIKNIKGMEQLKSQKSLFD